MVSAARGHVDYGQEGFIARFEYDQAIVGRVKEIQRRRWLKDKAAWIIEPHWPSVRRLLHIASELDWEITRKAREAEQRVKLESESLEYSVDVVHDSHGHAWFQCKVGDDDRLLQQVKALPGAVWDDSWWIPTDWEQCCEPLLEIVQSDMRLEVSHAAWQLLTESDVSHLFLRSCAPPPPAAMAAVEPSPSPSEPWTPATQDDAEDTLSSVTHDDDQFELSQDVPGHAAALPAGRRALPQSDKTSLPR